MKKHLSAIPRLSLFAAFTILITLVVCLTGFAEAEVRPSYKQKRDRKSGEEPLNKPSGLTEIDLDSRQNLKSRGDDFLRPENFASYFKNLDSEGGFEKLLKRESEDFGRKSAELVGETEADGYGYDDDEYYHFDFKRNDDAKNKAEKGSVQEDINKKEGLLSQNYGMNKNLNNQDNSQTVEMLSFKESHSNPNPTPEENLGKSDITKPLTPDAAHKKMPSEPLGSIQMSDLKENSAIDEKMKDRKDEATGVSSSGSSSDQKVAESKKTVKVNEEKDALKLKDAKFGEGSEKKEKEANVKESKESVASKTIKENIKSIDGSDNANAKVGSENIKLEENIEKISGKTKDRTFAEKMTENENVKLVDKINSDLVNPNKISQISNRASFVSNDFKENAGSLKPSRMESDEKSTAELSGRNFAFNDYQDASNPKDNSLREENEKGSYDFLGDAKDSLVDVGQKLKKDSDYITLPIAFEIKDEGQSEMYKTQQSAWKEHTKPQDQQQHINYEKPLKGPFHLNFPPGELENTEYHKNYLKSLRRYKAMGDSTKVLDTDSNPDKSREKNKGSKKKRSKKLNKKKSVTYESAGDRSQGAREASRPKKNSYSNSNGIDRCQDMRSQSSSNRMHSLDSKEKRDSARFEENKYEAQNQGSRERRKLAPKLEYEIKIINQNQQGSRDSPLLSLTRKRKKKELKSKRSDRIGEKFRILYPYSQISRGDAEKLKEAVNDLAETKFKRKAPAWKGKDQFETSKQAEDDNSKNRGAPLGYYTNRVKFGQKHFAPKEDKPSGSLDKEYGSRMSSFSSKKVPAEVNNNYLQRSWRDMQELKHDPMKRFDENAIFGKNHQNSLLLVKKDKNGDRIAKTFMNSNREDSEADLNSDQLANILSKDNDYIVLKKTDYNKFQKVEGMDSSQVRSGTDSQMLSPPSPSSAVRKHDSFRFNKQDSVKDNGKHNRAMFVRLYRSNDQKLHNANSKSSLKKTFEKFKDFADFFKDNEQDTPESQHTAQEVKDRGEIVFSEDKIPDPIIINNEVDGKSGNVKSKSQNSMSSITANFKQLDQEKKMDSMKFDEPSGMGMPVSEKSSWEPALKNAFPEAKSINSMQKNGNEIIVLDFDRHHLKTEQGKGAVLTKAPFEGGNDQMYMPYAPPQKNPTSLTIPGNRQVQFVLNEGTLPTFLESTPNKNSEGKFELKPNNYLMNNDQMGKSYSMSNSPENQPVITLPLNQFTQLPNLFKQYSDKKPNGANSNNNNFKTMTKKSPNRISSSQEKSNNFNQFLRDYRELSEINKEPLTNKKIKLNKKRNSNEYAILSSSSIPALSSYSDANIKQLGSILQNIMNSESESSAPEATGNKLGMTKNADTELEKSQKWPPSPYEYSSDALKEPQNRWTSADSEHLSSGDGNARFLSKNGEDVDQADDDEVKNFLQSVESSQDADGENNYQDKLWEELSMASSKIQRLRREGATERKLRQVIEEALPLRGKRRSRNHQNPSQNSRVAEKGNDKSIGRLDANNWMSKGSAKNSIKSNLAGGEQQQKKMQHLTKESPLQTCPKGEEAEPKDKRSLMPGKTRIESGQSKKETLESSDRDETNELIGSSKESVESKESQRQKRSPEDDLETSKVSKSEVKNHRILKNLKGEDNYQSLYSLGMRRKLFSIDGENEDPDGYYYADGNEEKVATETESDCVKNSLNECVDPFILDLFREDKSEENNGEIRERRSLIGSSHSNYKREIDLDESMPNDFQNFLVTSLGLDSHATAIGGQKRESVKKGTAAWGDRGTSADDYNQAVGKADSALEKREVSNSESVKRPDLKESSDYFQNRNEPEKRQLNAIEGSNRSGMEAKLKDKSAAKGKLSEYEEESKVPTQIRIQVTKASAKEKKSSKSETEGASGAASGEVEMAPKEKEYMEKNKFNAPVNLAGAANSQKLVPAPKYKFSVNPVEGETAEDPLNERYVLTPPFRRARRKKKKYIQENPMKPIKDFMAFDQKAMETLIRKYYADQNQMKKANQKMPASNHLPQVETVYNPTQGTNKAQIQGYKPVIKMNSLSNKNLANAKNSFHFNEASPFDEGMLRSYIKDKSMQQQSKDDKEPAKEFEDVKWKSYFKGTARLRQNAVPSNNQPEMFGYKPFGADATGAANLGKNENVNANAKKPLTNQMKWYQAPYNNYMNPSGVNLYNPYAAGSAKQKMTGPIWSMPNKEVPNTKNWRKFPNYMNGSPYSMDSKDKNPPNTGTYQTDDAWNIFDRYDKKKKPLSDKYKFRDSFVSALNPNWRPDNMKGKYSPQKFKYMQPYEEQEKSPNFDPTQTRVPLEPGKDADYPDTFEDVEYVDGDELRQEPLQFEAFGMAGNDKKEGKLYDLNGYQNVFNGYRNPDWDAILGEDDEESDEDYYENGENGMDQFSFLADSNFLPPELTKKALEDQKLRDYLYSDDSVYSGSNSDFSPKDNEMKIYGNNFEKAEFINPKIEDSFQPGASQMNFAEIKNDVDPYASSAILKKVNENSNILGKNLMKNLNRLNYDGNMRTAEKMLEHKNNLRNHRAPDLRTLGGPAIGKPGGQQNEMERNQRLLPIGSRFFYAAKTESQTAKNNPSASHYPQRRSDRNVYYWLPKRNSLNAELRGAENDFEYESEQNGKNFAGNFLNGEGDEGNEGRTKLATENGGNNKRNSQDSDKSEESDEDSEDVEDNLEGDSETISEDNILENVIGKYIMRKSVNVEPEQKSKEGFANGANIKDSDSRVDSEGLNKHKRNKKSLGDGDFYPEESSDVKIWQKRLSSGHLTENNFKKYHKKNQNAKRNSINLEAVSDLETISNEKEKINLENDPAEGKEEERRDSDLSWKSGNSCRNEAQIRKRSALSLFRKIGGKEKESKKEESMSAKTVGFEPILTTGDNKFESLSNERQEEVGGLKEQSDQDDQKLERSEPSEKNAINDGKKEEAPEEMQNDQADQLDGPWKIELNEKYDDKMSEPSPKDSKTGFSNVKEKKGSFSNVKEVKGSLRNLKEGKGSFSNVKEGKGSFSDADNQDVKAYLVIRKNVRAAEQTQKPAAEVLSPISGAFKREVGNSYLPKSEKGAGGDSKRNLWKRSEECSDSYCHPLNVAPSENSLNILEGNRALQNRKSISEADSKAQASHFIQRNTEKNSSLVSARDSRRNSGETGRILSNERLKRKSVFPPSSEANIMGDNRHVDEEMSKYLGQQIVEAILAHVSTNPRFKELIAPGLSGKAAAPIQQEETEASKGALNRAEYFEQVQNLLQKVMMDIEKIAEQHVRKRMCNKIDRESKEFLHFLLKVPIRGYKENANLDPYSIYSYTCSTKSPNPCFRFEKTSPERIEIQPTTPNPTENSNFQSITDVPEFDEKIRDNLKKKQSTLMKLIEDYQRLSELEKQTINVSFQYLQSELERTNELLSNLDGKECCSEQYCQPPGNEAEDIPNQFQVQGSDKGYECPMKSDSANNECDNNNQGCNSSPTTTPAPQSTGVLQFDPIESECQNNSESSSTENKSSNSKKVDSSGDQQGDGFEAVKALGNDNGQNGQNASTSENSQTDASSSEAPCSTCPTCPTPPTCPTCPTPPTCPTCPTCPQPNTQNSGQNGTAPPNNSERGKGGKKSNKESNLPVLLMPSKKTSEPSPSYKPDKKEKVKLGEEADKLPDSTEEGLGRADHPAKIDPDRFSLLEDFKNSESAIVSNGEEDSDHYSESRFDEGLEKFPMELEKILQTNKKGFYPEPKPRHLYAPIQNLFKNLNPSEGRRPAGPRSSIALGKNSRGPSNRKKRLHRTNFSKEKKSEDPKVTPGEYTMERDSDFEENPGLEYLIWSSMPPVRRRLNNLESDVESYKFPGYQKFQSARRKKIVQGVEGTEGNADLI